MKKVISCILVVLLCLTILPIGAFAADPVTGSCGDDVQWSYNAADGTLSITGTGATTAYTDKAGAFDAFKDGVKSVKVGEGITELNSYLLYGMTNLKSVSLPSTLEKIQTRAIANCAALTEISLPDKLRVLGAYAFQNDPALVKVTFEGRAPATVSGSKPFDGDAFELVRLCKEDSSWAAAAKWTTAKVTSFGGAVAQSPKHTWGTDSCTLCGAKTTGTHGDTVNWKFDPTNGKLTVTGTGIATNATAASSPFESIKGLVKSVEVGEGITTLGEYMFYGMLNLKTVTLPESLIKIQTRDFAYCRSLEEVSFTDKLTTLGAYAFEKSGIKTVTFAGRAPATISGLKPFNELTYTLNIPCKNDDSWADNTKWNAVKEAALGGVATEVLNHKWNGNKCDVCNTVKGTPVTAIKLDKETVTVNIWDSLALTATVEPAGADNKNIVWTSSDEKVLTVANGIVTPVGAGTADVTAASEENSEIKAVCKVTVIAANAGKFKTGLEWKFENGTLTITGSGATDSYELKDTTNAAKYPFLSFKDKVTKIVIGHGVTILKNHLFYEMKNLTEVELGDTVSRIETRVFKNCTSLQSIVMPPTLSYVGYEAFVGSGIKTVTFKGSAVSTTTTTSALPFKGLKYDIYVPCNDTTWTGAKISAIGGDATVNLAHDWQNGVCTVCKARLNNNVTSITLSATAISIYSNDYKDITATVTPKDASDTGIVWTSSNESVAKVSGTGRITGVAPGTAVVTATARDGGGAKATCSVTVMQGLGGTAGESARWTLVDGVLRITGTGALTNFSRNAQTDIANTPWRNVRDSIRTVIIDNGITAIKNYAFYGCSNITSVSLPESLTEIAYGAFQGTKSLKTIKLPSKIKKFGSQVFKDSGLKTVTFTGTLPESYGKNIFQNVTAVVYYQCNTFPRDFGKTLTWVKAHKFAKDANGIIKCTYCKTVDGKAVTKISLDKQNVTLLVGNTHQIKAKITPDDATYKNLEYKSGEDEVATVTKDGLVTAKGVGSTTVTVTALDTGKITAKCKITVKAGEGGYIGDIFWNYDNGKLTLSGVGDIPDVSGKAPWAKNADKITSVEVGEGITKIGANAFAGLKKLTDLVLPESLTEIGIDAFRNAASLTKVTFPADIKSIGEKAFAGSGLKEIIFTRAIPGFGTGVFEGVTAVAKALCTENTVDLGKNITWEKMHDYQDVGGHKECLLCGEREGSFFTSIWFILIAAVVVIGACTAIIIASKKRKKVK